MSTTITHQQTSALRKPQSEMMKEYLAHGPMTATERLVAQDGSGIGDYISSSSSFPSEGMTRGEELYLKRACLDKLVRQIQGSGK